MSTVALEQLPNSLRHDTAKVLCDVESMLNGLDMKLKNRHWYNRGEKYFRVAFIVKAIIGSANLKFQIASKDGKVLSRDHEAIQVKWEPPKEVISGEQVNMDGMYKQNSLH